MHQIDFISQEVNRMETTGRLIEEQVYFIHLLLINKIVITFIVFIVKRISTC